MMQYQALTGGVRGAWSLETEALHFWGEAQSSNLRQ